MQQFFITGSLVLKQSRAQGFSLVNRPFPSCFEPHYESEAKCKAFIMKISFHSHANKTKFHLKSFVTSLVFIMRFTATRKRLIAEERKCHGNG